MKYLEIQELALLASMLSNSSHSVRVTTRIEAYSCKSVASERKLMKSLDQEFTTDLEVSISSSSPDGLPSTSLESAFGRMDRKDCRKTFWLLISTLNAAYPDHNFSRIKAEEFQAESARTVLMKLSEALELDRFGSDFASTLGALSTSPECIPKNSSETCQEPNLGRSFLAGIHPLIGQVLNPVIDLSQCEVYSYSPDPDSDPHAVVSDDDEDVESVASSIFGSNKHDHIQTLPTHPSEDAMWEIEGVEAPLYLHSNTAYDLLTRTISTPSSPQSPGESHRIFSQRDKRFPRPNSRSPSPLVDSFKDPECQASSLRPLSSSHETNCEEESAGGLLWSSHYFFYNRKKKRILFISTWGRKAFMSAAMDESWIDHQNHREAGYSSNNYCISPTMIGPAGSWQNPPNISQPKGNMTTTHQSRAKLNSSGPKRNRTSKLPKRHDLPYGPQSFERTVDSLEAPTPTSSVSGVSRPLKKRRSRHNL